MKENQFQKAARLHDLKLIAKGKGWEQVKEFIFLAPRFKTLHDLSAADSEKLDYIEENAIFLACPTIDDVLARPIVEFHERSDREGETKWINPVGGQTTKGNVVMVLDKDGGEDLLLQFYSPLEDGTASKLSFGLTREAAEVLCDALKKKIDNY